MSGILQDIPLSLDNCGFHEAAAEVNKLFPAKCVNAVNNFIVEVSIVLKNYDHW